MPNIKHNHLKYRIRYGHYKRCKKINKELTNAYNLFDNVKIEPTHTLYKLLNFQQSPFYTFIQKMLTMKL